MFRGRAYLLRFDSKFLQRHVMTSCKRTQ